ncbi:multiple sugar transport system substrate-binding protein [Friedmanniella endophytica]|uniref:Multiple sugar transport system substrate-binding protein n=1 Tax=Microlunatus kandeliicorticis TaxID=1759536 RepID=A0A7W3IS15_9ACTN|nr:extracellular solute-binding protein [Microlunatus kandeliicorticis]MBA8794133.1 multiple sugar transport system substrate-binding protein [Microlunatus kandeliicorticis]
MGVNRRQFLIGGLGAMAATAGLAGLSGCGGSSSSGSATSGDLAFTWWGNDVRNKETTEAIAAYGKANPGVKISPQPGEWASYWDKLATQTAANNAPDVIQMDMAYISEYGNRGALLDLSKYGADTSKFAAGTVDSGKIDGTLYGINAGINTPTILVNPKLFAKAGIDVPDDKTWTWNDYKQIAGELTGKLGNGIVGTASPFNDATLSAWLRQQGKELFVDKGLGFTATDVVGWFQLMLDFQNAKAMPSASAITEEASQSLDQGSLVTGKAAMAYFWSNQVEAVNQAAGTEMKLLRYPSLAGKAAERKAWYKASMLWSASSRSKSPEAAVALINWWVNSTDCANICLAERGIPANTEVLGTVKPKLSKAQQSVATFIDEIKPELADTPIAPPPGGGTLGDVMSRAMSDLLFGRSNVNDAAKKFVDELTSNLSAS